MKASQLQFYILYGVEEGLPPPILGREFALSMFGLCLDEVWALFIGGNVGMLSLPSENSIDGRNAPDCDVLDGELFVLGFHATENSTQHHLPRKQLSSDEPLELL